MPLLILPTSYMVGVGEGVRVKDKAGKWDWRNRNEGSRQLETSPIYLLLGGIEKEGRMLIVVVGKGVEGSQWKDPWGCPCLWSVPKKAGQCASAPCPGQTGSRSAPKVDNGEGNGGEGVRDGT